MSPSLIKLVIGIWAHNVALVCVSIIRHDVKIIILIIIGLFRADGKRPDGLTLIPWQSGKSLCRDVTVTCPLAASYIKGAARQAGSTAEIAASRNRRSILRLRPATSSSPLRWKRWASSVPQPANSSAVWVTEFPPAQARLERHVFSSRESRCCCSASTLSYSTTACRR